MKIAMNLSLLLSFCTITYSAPIGLVLSGGGAKGAYEVGVWQAMSDIGLAGNVQALSGTSIGGINAALFASFPDSRKGEELWSANLPSVFVANSNVLEWASEKRFVMFLDKRLQDYAETAGIPVSALPADSRTAIEKEARTDFNRQEWNRAGKAALETFIKTYAAEKTDGLCDSDALRSVLWKSLPETWSDYAPSVYVSALEKDTWTLRTFRLNDQSPSNRIDRLVASTAIPGVFETVQIDGKVFVDGGWESKGGDNVPLEPILENHPEIKTVIIVYLDDKDHYNKNRFDKNHSAAVAAGVRPVEIVPSENIGRGWNGWQGVFDASPETAKHLIELGRKDARKALREAGLAD